MEIVAALRPEWIVVEKVPNLLHINSGRDFQAVVSRIAECGYLGFARVLDSSYFGIPRLFMVAGLGHHPSAEFMADAETVGGIPCAAGSEWIARPAHTWAGNTLTAPNKYERQNSRINLDSEPLIAEEGGWDQMVERSREVELHGVSKGLDASNAEEAYAAGNAVSLPIAQWIAEILNRS
jgi:DNA (cytosine-5)-methyltransferase 1